MRSIGQVIADNLATIVCGCIIVALFAASMWAYGPGRLAQASAGSAGQDTGAGTKARAIIHDADGNTHEVALTQDQSVTIDTSRGHNVVGVQDGSIRMVESDCPHGDCLRQPAIAHPSERIVCLPNELWVEVVSGADAPGTGVDFVTG